MKKIYILAAAALFSSVGFAQSLSQKEGYVLETKSFNVKHSNSKTPTDTLGLNPNGNYVPDEFAKGNVVTTWSYTGGGYVCGNNVDSLDHCAQGYANINAASIGIEGILAMFTKKNYAGGGNSTITFNVYNMAANSAYEWDGVNPPTLTADGPSGSPVATTTMPIANADTVFGNLSYAALSTPYITTGDFALSMDVTSFRNTQDTVGLFVDGNGEGYNLSFHYYDGLNNFILTRDLFTSAPNRNIALFPVIDANAVGIDDIDFFNGMQLSAFPNPVVDQTTISYNLNENMKNVKLIVYDMTGKEVHNVNYGSQAKGSYNVTIDASDFTSGNYFYSLIANGQRLTKRMVVTK